MLRNTNLRSPHKCSCTGHTQHVSHLMCECLFGHVWVRDSIPFDYLIIIMKRRPKGWAVHVGNRVSSVLMAPRSSGWNPQLGVLRRGVGCEEG